MQHATFTELHCAQNKQYLLVRALFIPCSTQLLRSCIVRKINSTYLSAHSSYHAARNFYGVRKINITYLSAHSLYHAAHNFYGVRKINITNLSANSLYHTAHNFYGVRKINITNLSAHACHFCISEMRFSTLLFTFFSTKVHATTRNNTQHISFSHNLTNTRLLCTQYSLTIKYYSQWPPPHSLSKFPTLKTSAPRYLRHTCA